MTESAAEDIATHRFVPDDRLFFDTNIWLFLYGPRVNPRDPAVLTYSSAFKRIRNAKSELYVDALVLSEFANRCARIELHSGESGAKYATFKEFRDSSDFRDNVAPTISLLMHRILDDCKVIDTRLSAFDASDLFAQFSTGGHDFNDLVIAELCRDESLTLVTDDAGFASASIKILTSNKRLLRP